MMASALPGDLSWRSIAVAVVLIVVGGGLLAWALLQTTLEEAQPDPRVLFMKRRPCPANGHTRGDCPGYAISHIKPLCAGGADRPGNMQWLATAEARKKERLDAQECRTLRRQKRAS